MNYLYDNNYYDVVVIKKNNKNIYIRVKDDLKIYVTCPFLYTSFELKKLIKDNTSSIDNMIAKQLQRKNTTVKECKSLLGKPINIVYDCVNRPVFKDNTLIVKDDEMLDRWYYKQAKEIFKTYLDEAHEVFEEKIPYPTLKIRSMKTRWGVNNRRDNSVTLNLELIKKDQEYLNYVIVHELSHFVHFDHSKDFWLTVEKYCPDYKRVRKELKY